MSEYLDCLTKEAWWKAAAPSGSRAMDLAPRGAPPGRVVKTAEILEHYLRGKTAHLEAIAKP